MPDSNVPDWAKALPAELQTNDAILRTPDIATAAKRLVDLTAYQGRSVAIPKDDDADGLKAFDEKVSKFGYARVGAVPEKPDDYAAPLDGLPETAKGFADMRRKAYHDLKLPKAIAERLLASDIEQFKAAHESSTKALADLKAHYGDKFDATIKNAEKVAGKFGLQNILRSEHSNNRGLFDLFNQMASTMKEDPVNAGSGSGGSGRTKEQVKAELLTKMDESASLLEGSPERVAKDQEVQRLLAEMEALRAA